MDRVIEPNELAGWFEAYGPALVLYARQWVLSAAEDVVQEAFARLISQRDRPRDVKGSVAGGLLLTGPKGMVDAGKASLDAKGDSRPAARKELLAAFQSCADMQAQALLLPSSDTRRVIEEMLPELPKQLGGGPSTAVTRGMMWAAIGATLSPRPALRARAQAQDANAATAFCAWAGRAIQALANHPEAKEELPALGGLLPLLTPKPQGDQVALDLAGKDLGRVAIDLVAPLVTTAREAARRAEVANRVRTICMAVHAYAANHRNQFPPDLQTLVDAKLLKAGQLANPLRPEQKSGFVYLFPAATVQKANPMDIMVYETYDRWHGSACVGFVDGHVETFSTDEDRARLEKAIAAAKVPASQPATSRPAKQPS